MPEQTNRDRWTAAGRAFTLLEMLAVVAILGIAGAMLVPSFSETGVLRVQGAVRTIVGDLTFAQCDAVAFQEKRAVVFDVASSTYRVVSVPGDVVDVDTNTMYDPTRPSGKYQVDFRDDAFGDSRITAADFDGTNQVIFDAMGGPVADATGNTASQGGHVRVEGSGAIYDIIVEAFTGRVTVTKVR